MTQSEQIQKLMTENMFLKQQNNQLFLDFKKGKEALNLLEELLMTGALNNIYSSTVENLLKK